MAFDGIITYGISQELARLIVPGKIEKVYQPGINELILQIHASGGNHRLYISSDSQSARICITNEKFKNPDEPPNFCMLLRKHIQGGRITDIRQVGSERIIEIDIEAQSELGYAVSKRLIVEIMGKHSNIVLMDIDSGKIIDGIKHISIDVNRYRQILPGMEYRYPPAQDKMPFKDVNSDEDLLLGQQIGMEVRRKMLADPKFLMNKIGGISPAISRELATNESPAARLMEITDAIDHDHSAPTIYMDANGAPIEFHLTDLAEYADHETLRFCTLSECVEYFYQHRDRTNTIRMRSQPVVKSISSHLDKARLKRQRICEDILEAEGADKYRIYGELITANIHMIQPGADSVTVINYYDNEPIDIPLDEKISASKNAQHYFKLYSKARNALKEKSSQLEDTDQDIAYLESVLESAERAESEDVLDAIRSELIDAGYMRVKSSERNIRRNKGKKKPELISYEISDGSIVYVGRNNMENDYLSTRMAGRGDLWFHTKDIPGSHVVLMMNGRTVEDLPDELIYEAARIAARHSKGRDSENVPVDFTYIKHVKKPSGAKPGMVIFTHNTTVYVTP